MARLESNGPVIVTGGAGAIGSVLTRALLDRGNEVRVVDNLSSGRREHLPKPARDSQLHLHVVDVRDPIPLKPIFDGVNDVWHLAANPDIQKGTSDPLVDFENGTRATFNVLEAARAAGVTRFFFASSSAVYGQPTIFPTPETYGPLVPQSQYGAAKLASEAMCGAYAHSYGLRTFSFRFANIIGPAMTHGILFDFSERLRSDPSRLRVLGDGRQVKSYLRTEECVEAMLTATEKAKDPVNIFNIGSNDQISVREIAQRVVAAYGDRARVEFTGGDRGWVGDIPQQLLSIDRIRSMGWAPRRTSAEAIALTIREIAHARRD